MVDVCIIGGGVIGAAIARECTRYPLSVALLEQHLDLAEGATKANSAIVHAGYDARPGSLKARYNRDGHKLFKAWCQELSVPYHMNGSLVVGFDDTDRPALAHLADQGRKNGVSGLELLDRQGLQALEPKINPQACWALYAPTAAITSPYELTLELAAHALLNGASIHCDTHVQSVIREKNHFICQTNQGSFACRTLVNAAGVEADWLNNQLSQDQFAIRPRRGEYLMLTKEGGRAFQSTLFQLPTDRGKGVLIAPTVEQTVLLGPTAEDIDERHATVTSASGFRKILQAATLSWPDLPTQQFLTAFSGIRASSDRGDFIVGPSEDVAGLFLACGIDSPGLTAAPAIALDLAQQLAVYCQVDPKQHMHPPQAKATPFRLMTRAQQREAISRDSAYGHIICRCEDVTEAEVVAAIHRPVGARTVDGIKRRTRAGMGRCQGGFCLSRVMAILHRELGTPMSDLAKFGHKAKLVTGAWPQTGPGSGRPEEGTP